MLGHGAQGTELSDLKSFGFQKPSFANIAMHEKAYVVDKEELSCSGGDISTALREGSSSMQHIQLNVRATC